jgi:UDP-N-acetylmuramyl pentapeptide synthase
MRLALLLDDVPPRDAGVEISSLAYDNRVVAEGALFFCVPGYTRDGHDFAAPVRRRRARDACDQRSAHAERAAAARSASVVCARRCDWHSRFRAASPTRSILSHVSEPASPADCGR